MFNGVAFHLELGSEVSFWTYSVTKKIGKMDLKLSSEKIKWYSAVTKHSNATSGCRALLCGDFFFFGGDYLPAQSP